MALAPPKPGAGPVQSVNAALTPYALSAIPYPSRKPPMPASLVRDCVAAPWTSDAPRPWPTRRQADFIIHGHVNPYRRPGRVTVPDLALYLHMSLSQPPRAGSYAVPRDGAPDLAIEIPSAATWQHDATRYANDEGAISKPAFYRTYETAEYWFHDSDTCRQGKAVRLENVRRRSEGVYAAIEPDRRGHWRSAMAETVWGMGRDIIGSWNGIGTLLCRLRDSQTGAWHPLLEERHRHLTNGATTGWL